MIPEFPQFKNLELSDKKEVEKFTCKFPPYSDFNFVSMWSWDTEGDMRLSILNNNLVVRFADYLTGEPFYSFIGDNKVNATIETLFQLIRQEGLPCILKLVPEEVITGLDVKKFNIAEDRGHFDYIVSVDKLMPHRGEIRKLSTRRKLIQKFKDSRKFEVRQIDIKDPDIQEEIKSVFVEWEMGVERDAKAANHLHRALEKFFLIDTPDDILSFGAYVDGKLAGYSISERCADNFAIGHFQQGNLKVFSGIYALLMHETAPFFKEKGCTNINLEQDLSIPGLEKWKSSHHPVGFLKKYKIAPVETA